MIGIYRIYRIETGKSYVGQSVDIEKRVYEHFANWGNSSYIHNAISKYGKETFDWEVLEICLEAQLDDRECHWIASLDTIAPYGYNLRGGGANGRHSEESRKKMSYTGQKIQQSRVADGTHHMLGGEIQRKRVADGAHHFLDENRTPEFEAKRKKAASEAVSKSNQKRIADGTHHWLGPESNAKRIADGTHPFLGENNPSHQRVADGTHNFLPENRTPEFIEKQSKAASEGSIKSNQERIANGTHNFLPENLDPEMVKRRTITLRRKRHKVYWCFIIAVARFRYETHDYREKRRRELLSQGIIDTSDAEQLFMFDDE